MSQSGRYATDAFVHRLYEAPPKLAFSPTFNLRQFNEWKEALRGKAMELLQIPDTKIHCPCVNLINQKKRDGYRIFKYEIQPEEDLWVPFLMLVPDGIHSNKKAPVVFCCPGSATPKESLCGEDCIDFSYEPATDRWKYPFANAQALHFVKKGFIAVACDNPATGEQAGEYDRAQLSLKMLAKGRNYVGLSVMIRQAILDWVKTLDIVDLTSIGLSAHSLGTESTMFMALIDQDIKAVVHNDFVADNNTRVLACYPPDRFLYGAHWHLVPNMLDWFTFVDLLAAFAPKPLMITEGGVTSDLQRIQKAYHVAKKPENIDIRYYAEFEDEKDRLYDHKPIPNQISMEEYFKYANVNPKHHFYKFETAVPWLVQALTN